MRITYDVDADAAFVYLVDVIGAGQIARSQMCDLDIREGAVILAMDTEDHLLGIEILGASKLLSAETIASANAPDPRR